MPLSIQTALNTLKISPYPSRDTYKTTVLIVSLFLSSEAPVANPKPEGIRAHSVKFGRTRQALIIDILQEADGPK